MEKKENWEGLLHEGEELKWTGTPKNVKLLASASRGKSLLLWGIGLAWLAASVLVILPKILATDDSAVHMAIVMILIDCLPVLMLSMPFSDCKILNRQTQYAVTNRRVLVRSRDQLMTLLLNSSTQIEARGREGGTGNILLGDAVGKSDFSLRKAAIDGILDKKKITGLVLYHVEKPQAVKEILETGKKRG